MRRPTAAAEPVAIREEVQLDAPRQVNVPDRRRAEAGSIAGMTSTNMPSTHELSA